MKDNIVLNLVMMFIGIFLLNSCQQSDKTFLQQLQQINARLDVDPHGVVNEMIPLEGVLMMASKSTQMYYWLILADAQNKAYIKMISSEKMQDVVAFYRHKKDNMLLIRALYLLGCAYRDEGESPDALAAYNEALVFAERGKMTNDILMLKAKIYGQIGDLYEKQFLPENMIDANQKAYHYSMLAKDTMSAAVFLTYCSSGYNVLGNYRKVIATSSKAIALLKKVGCSKKAAMCCGSMVNAYLKLDQPVKARECMECYEKQSGRFDKYGQIEKGREFFYFEKGQYYLYVNSLDSAEYYFRKTLTNREDGDCQEAGLRGLYQLYKKTGNKDSLAKYADLAYQINDKRILELSSREIQNMQQLYNYTQSKELAKLEQNRSEKLKFWLIVAGGCLFICLLLFLFYYRHIMAKRRQERNGYMKKLEKLLDAKKQQKMLLDNKIDEIMDANNIQIEQLQKQLAEYQKRQNISDREMRDDEAQVSPICLHLHKVAIGQARITDDEWAKLETVLFQSFPIFRVKLMAVKTYVLLDDYRLCLLTRLHFSPSEIGNILNIKASNVTMKRKRMLKVIFDKDGTAKEFDKLLQALY